VRINWRLCCYWVLPNVLLALSVALTLTVRSNGPLYGEEEVSRWMRDNTPAVIDLFAELIDPTLTDIGAPLVFVAIALLVWWRWGRYSALVLGLAGALTGLTRVGDLVNRPRPTSALTWSEYSYGNGGYPSGHVMFTVLVLGTIAILARHHVKSRTATWIVATMLLLIVLTAWSRISQLDHWPLDVAGGILIGSTGLLGVAWLYRRVPALAMSRPRLKRFLQT
jgi:membrane-associated phospholipid phosphatase